MGLTEHSQQDISRTAAAAASLHSVTAKQTRPVIRAVAAAAAAVLLTGPGCLATAVDLTDQRLVQTAGACVARRRKKRVRKHGDWHVLAAEWPAPAAESETRAFFAAPSWQP